MESGVAVLQMRFAITGGSKQSLRDFTLAFNKQETPDGVGYGGIANAFCYKQEAPSGAGAINLAFYKQETPDGVGTFHSASLPSTSRNTSISPSDGSCPLFLVLKYS